MTKDAINQYDNVAANNTDVGGVDTSSTMAPSDVNDAVRELMSHLADVDDGTSSLTSPDINGGTIDGTVIGASSAAAITGTTITGTSFVSSGDMTFGDNDKAIFGAGSDLQIWHNGSHSVIADLGTGDLQIRAENFKVVNSDFSSTMLRANVGGDVELYYNNAQKLATTATGVDITGTLTSDGLTVDGNVGIGTTAPDGKLDIATGGTTDVVAALGGTFPAFTYRNGTGTWFHAGKHPSSDYFYIGRGATPTTNVDVVVDSGGRLITGNNASINVLNVEAGFQNYSGAGYMTAGKFAADAFAPFYTFVKSRNATVGAHTIVQNGDDLGTIAFTGSDGTNFIRGAQIRVQVDGTPGTNDMPGRLVFSTTADGASSPTERMRIDSSGNVGIGSSAPSSPGGSINLLLNGTTPIIKSAGTTSARYDLATTTANSYSIISLNDNSGSPYLQLTSGSGVANHYYDGPTHIWRNTAGTERMRIDSSGNVGIGTSSPTANTNFTSLNLDGTSGSEIWFDASGTAATRLSGTATETRITAQASGSVITMFTGATERMRISSTGNIGIGNSSPAGPLEVLNANIGGSSGEEGFLIGSTGRLNTSTDDAIAWYMNDSSASAGTHNYIVFRYQGTTIGDIDTTDNSTIRYNTFTGAHWSQFTDHSQPDIPLGTVMSTINEMCNHTQFEYVDENGETQKTDIAGSFEIGSTHTIYIDEDGAQAEGTAIAQSTHKRLAKVKVSDTAGDKSVYGVFAGHYKDGDSSIESLGLGAIRVGSGVTVANGDLLESAGDGTARPQTGDNADLFKASTIAKVTSTVVIETYDDGSYTVPCTLHCG